MMTRVHAAEESMCHDIGLVLVGFLAWGRVAGAFCRRALDVIDHSYLTMT